MSYYTLDIRDRFFAQRICHPYSGVFDDDEIYKTRVNGEF
jgi:hypothetical protein